MPMKDKQVVGKAGWRPGEWAHAAGVSRSLTYELLAEGKIDSVKLGSARIITTSPVDFLSSLKGAA
jgi:hypothetical protein